jgi:hypothetical protein
MLSRMRIVEKDALSVRRRIQFLALIVLYAAIIAPRVDSAEL